METWLLVLLSLSLPLLLLLVRNKNTNTKNRRLPPGPPAVPVLGNLLWLRHSAADIEPILRDLHARYGPVVGLRIGSRLTVLVADHAIAHRALVEQGAALADRPITSIEVRRILTSGQHNITSSNYGPLWRQLRRNLVSETLHPSRVKLFAPVRSWVLDVLLSKLRENADAVAVVENFQFAMFCLLVVMCFGEKLEEDAVREIAAAQRGLLLYGWKLDVFSFAPAVTRHLFRGRMKTALAMRQRQKTIHLPLIKARMEYKQKSGHEEDAKRFAHSYVDTLLDLRLQDEGGRALTDDEMVVLCSEFLTAGTDTMSTALQWIMAELVKNPKIQEKLWNEIKTTSGYVSETEEIKEEDIQKMPYLKAVVLEGLRKHPPGHFVLPHAPSEDMEIGGYFVPKGTTVNFMVAEMGRDEKAWDRPMEFVPERFLEGGDGEGVDITGSREIKMMPFGVGRRICAGLGIAMLYLEYFVANLVREFEWKEVEGEEVDFGEKMEFTVVMKKPLKARLVPRRKT